jgi:hypothetical protein
MCDQHDDADSRILSQAFGRLGQFGNEDGIEGVMPLGPVQRQARHAASVSF